MADKKVTVRFVPRGRSSITPEMLDSAPAETLSKAIDPTHANAKKGWMTLTSQGIACEHTPLNRLTADMTESAFKEMFSGTKLEMQSMSSERGILAAGERHSADAMVLPDAIKDDFLFAYIPRPVEYFSPLAIPPHEDIYHLRLSSVAMALNAPRCHLSGWNGEGVRVAMADSGFWLHPYYVRSGFRLIPTSSPGSGPPDEDSSGHGTGEAANVFAIAPQCRLYGVKHGSSAASTLETCIAQKPDVMTNSWGYDIDDVSREKLKTNDPSMFNEVVDVESVLGTAIDQNIVVLFSAGNGHRAFPGSHPDVIAVGGVTLNEDGSLEASNYASSFSSKLFPGRDSPDLCGIVGRSGTKPQSAHIALPVPPDSNLDGDNFASGAKETGWGIFSGTSAACPQVAGVCALIKQIDPRLSPAQVRQILEARSIDISKGKTALGDKAKQGDDRATGAGLVDALRACGYVVGVA